VQLVNGQHMMYRCHKLFSTQFNPFCSMKKLPLNITTCSQTLSHGKVCQYTPVIFLARHPSHYITKKNSAWKGLWHAQCVSIPNWQFKKKVACQTSMTLSVNTLHIRQDFSELFPGESSQSSNITNTLNFKKSGKAMNVKQ